MSKLVRLGSFTFDGARACLHGPAGQVSLRRKSFEVLRYLIDRPDRVISKEELVEAVWSNVVVGDDSLAQCVTEIRRALGRSGRDIIKTVHRRGYILSLPATSLDALAATSGATTSISMPLPDRPSIAVLPFTNLGGQPQDDYFSDGIAEDIITELSRFSELFVIARNSSFQYKGKYPDIRQVGRELGVQYVLEGSVRRAGDRVRITGQLIDAATGAHRWAERYDRELEDVFAVQDEVARSIVAILVAHVNKAEAGRTLLKPPATWQAYDYYLRASDMLASFWSSTRVDELYETRRLLEKSISKDPNYARAYAMLSYTHTNAYVQPHDADYVHPAALERAIKFARKGVHLDPNLPHPHACLGLALTWKHEHDESIAEFEKAIALNRNFTDWRFAVALVHGGEPERAIHMLERHMRLDPFYPAYVPGWRGVANYMLERYSEALVYLRECVARAPNLQIGHIWLAGIYAQMGRMEDARAETAEALRIDPRFSIELDRVLSSFRDSNDTQHYFDGMRKAGVPEKRHD